MLTTRSVKNEGRAVQLECCLYRPSLHGSGHYSLYIGSVGLVFIYMLAATCGNSHIENSKGREQINYIRLTHMENNHSEVLPFLT